MHVHACVTYCKSISSLLRYEELLKQKRVHLFAIIQIGYKIQNNQKSNV